MNRRIKRAPKVLRAYGGKIVIWPRGGYGWHYEVRTSRRYRPTGRLQFGEEGVPRFLRYAIGYVTGSTKTLARARLRAVNGLKVQFERRASPPAVKGWRAVAVGTEHSESSFYDQQRHLIDERRVHKVEWSVPQNSEKW